MANDRSPARPAPKSCGLDGWAGEPVLHEVEQIHRTVLVDGGQMYMALMRRLIDGVLLTLYRRCTAKDCRR
ncbi:hypothetical protein [Streptomyces nojiriensis]|uniref:hypothetical protein n=1 Tax=Streptomyces nojiriensis TaxID=66374 RepID=UPI003658B164